MRLYNGEQVALYFEFLSHYSQMLKPIAIFGVVIFAYNTIERQPWAQDTIGRYKGLGSLIFSAIVSIWGTIFVEAWKRLEARRVTGHDEF